MAREITVSIWERRGLLLYRLEWIFRKRMEKPHRLYHAALILPVISAGQ